MKGLIKKDFILISEQKNVLMAMCIIAVIVSLFGKSSEDFARGFLNSYIPFIAAVVGMSTISYDENDNGLVYIMSMPINRKMYVNSKYIVGLITSFIGVIVVLALNICLSILTESNANISEMVILTASILSVCLIIQSIGIPGYIKYGPQKGAVAMIVTVAVIFAICFGVIKLMEMKGIYVDELLMNMSNGEDSAFAGLLVVVAAICLIISYSISQKFMSKKEF